MHRHLIYISLLSVLVLASCGGVASSYTLSHAPTGFNFTNTSGNTIDKMGGGSIIQLRDSENNIIIQFTIDGDVDFANVVADRDDLRTLAHFPSSSDKSGLTGNITLFVPCNDTINTIRVCPDATTLFEIANGCPGEITLTDSETTSGNYTWDNATSRSGDNDCEVWATVDNFNTGALGQTLDGAE